jgi:chromosome partitioning protein
MLHAAPFTVPGSPHVVVVGNEKGGSGKTTIAMHLAVALLKLGQRVATIDLDGNQKGLTQYIENRRIWANYRRVDLEVPVHCYIPQAGDRKTGDSEAEQLSAFEQAVASIGESVDFLVIDTPSAETYLVRLSHLVADTLVTPLTDSFLDFGTLASVDPITREVTATGSYAAMVCDARERRRSFDQHRIEWVVVRNRSSLSHLVDRSLGKLAMSLGFRALEGCAERVLYRQFFPSGLTALDALDERTLGDRPTRMHQIAQEEMRDFVELLQLPTNGRGRRAAAARAEWFAATPLDNIAILADEALKRTGAPQEAQQDRGTGEAASDPSTASR